MAKYRVEISRSAEKVLFTLPREISTLILDRIRALALNPFPHDCCKLHGAGNVYRIRIQRYRVIYEILSHHLLVRVLKIGHRKDIYR